MVASYCLCEAVVDWVLLAVFVCRGAQSCLGSLWVWGSGVPDAVWAKEVGFASPHLPSARAPPVSSGMGAAGWRQQRAEVCSRSRWRSGCVGRAAGAVLGLRLLQVWDDPSVGVLDPWPDSGILSLSRRVDCLTSLTTFPPRSYRQESSLMWLNFIIITFNV